MNHAVSPIHQLDVQSVSYRRQQIAHLFSTAYSVQFAVRMSQVVIATPGAFGTPVSGVFMSTAVVAL